MKKQLFWLTAAAGILCCGMMALVDGVWQPGYLIKSVIKICLFLLLPVLLACTTGGMELKTLFRVQKQGFGTALLLGLGLYAVIVGGFFLLRPFVDFSGIAENLSKNAGVTRENFLFVSLYISFANSLLEEFFFRGFLLRGFGTALPALAACICSAVLFSLYHTAMMLGWFPFWLFALVLLGLAAGGVIFTLLNRKTGTVYTSWFVHMFANFAINTVGFLLL